jgi:hypothetical protein
MQRLLLIALPVLALTVSGWPPLAAPAQASCAEDAGPAGSEVIFVGTPREERRGYTRFDVDEIWAGPDLAPSVWVLSGQQQPGFPWFLIQGVSGSTDADFVDVGDGQRWVVGATSAFATSGCSVALVDEPGSTRPGGARPPVAGGLRGVDPPASWWEIGGWLLVAAAVPLLMVVGWRRRVSRGARRPPATAPPAPPSTS